jgi:hypothetical protein
LLRYPYEVQSEEEYFDEIQDVKVTKYMLDRAISWISSRGGSNRKSSKTIKKPPLSKRAGKPITPKERPANVINLMEALRRSLGKPAPTKVAKPDKKPRKAAGTQKEMLMPSPVRSNQRSRRRTSLQQCGSAGRRNLYGVLDEKVRTASRGHIRIGDGHGVGRRTSAAAQCGNGAGGFESWKRAFGEEARAKGIGAGAEAALMQVNYASATIASAYRSISSWLSVAPRRSSPGGGD